MEDLEALRTAIRNMHGVDATWIESIPVHETFQGETVWQGEVQVFSLIDHPQAFRCYAWSYSTEDTQRRYGALLEIGPGVRDAVIAFARRTRCGAP